MSPCSIRGHPPKALPLHGMERTIIRMDARRFDALAEALTYAPTRADVFASLPILRCVAAWAPNMPRPITSSGRRSGHRHNHPHPAGRRSSSGGNRYNDRQRGPAARFRLFVRSPRRRRRRSHLPPYYAEIMPGEAVIPLAAPPSSSCSKSAMPMAWSACRRPRSLLAV